MKPLTYLFILHPNNPIILINLSGERNPTKMGEMEEMKDRARVFMHHLKKGLKKVKSSCKKGWGKTKNAAATWNKLTFPIEKRLTKAGQKSTHEF